jgi:hypothetical protein
MTTAWHPGDARSSGAAGRRVARRTTAMKQRSAVHVKKSDTARNMRESRLEELDRAKKISEIVALLHRAADEAPAAASLLDARIAELRAESAALNPPLEYCGKCDFEWDGRSEPPSEQTDECWHAAMRALWNELTLYNIERAPDEALDELLARLDAAVLAQDANRCAMAS